MSYMLRANNISTVTPGAPTVVKFDLGHTLDKIKLELLGGLTVDKVKKMELRINGRMVYETTAADQVLHSKYKDITHPANVLVIDFTEFNARNGATEQLVASIPTVLLQDLSLEVEIDASAPATSKIKCGQVVRGPTNNPYIVKQFRHMFALESIGQNSLFLPRGTAGATIKRIWIHETVSNQISDIELNVNNGRIMEVSREAYEAEQVANKLVPQDKLLVLDFISDGNLNGAINTAAPQGKQPPNVELRVNATALGTVKMYFEIIDHMSRL